MRIGLRDAGGEVRGHLRLLRYSAQSLLQPPMQNETQPKHSKSGELLRLASCCFPYEAIRLSLTRKGLTPKRGRLNNAVWHGGRMIEQRGIFIEAARSENGTNHPVGKGRNTEGGVHRVKRV